MGSEVVWRDLRAVVCTTVAAAEAAALANNSGSGARTFWKEGLSVMETYVTLGSRRERSAIWKYKDQGDTRANVARQYTVAGFGEC